MKAFLKKLMLVLSIFALCLFSITASVGCNSGEQSTSEGTANLRYEKISGKDEYRLMGLGLASELDIVIPDTYNGLPITEIGDYAFFNCVYIKSITIGNNVRSIGYAAFQNCSNLTSVVIGNSVTSIGDFAFENCSNLQYYVEDSIKYLGNPNNHYIYLVSATSKDITSVVIPDSVVLIAENAFAWCNNLAEVYYGGNIESWLKIGDLSNLMQYGSFKDLYFNNQLVTEVVIPKGITSIPAYAFSACDDIISVKIPDSVTSIGESAFVNCINLISIEIPDSVTSIDYAAFAWCNNLVEVYYGGNIESWLKISDLSNLMGSVSNATGKDLYFNNQLVTKVVVPKGTTSIPARAFSECADITSVEIPDSVTSIGNSAFSCCRSLTSVVIPDSVTSIGSYAFYSCSSLTSVVIPDSVTSIGDWAFYCCRSLTSIKYRGTQAQWDTISIGMGWDSTTGNYTITYNYTGE